MSRSPARRLLVVMAVVLAGIFAGFSLMLVQNGFFLFGDLRHELPPCFEIGAPYHHRFRAGCAGKVATPTGTASLQFNEDAIREPARAEVMKQSHRVLVLGDSFVEGWWAESDQTLSARLSLELPGWYFINAGLRSTGPSLQTLRLTELLRTYRPQALLWILNDTDGYDDRLACAAADDLNKTVELRQYGIPELQLDGWRKGLVSLLGDSLLSHRLRLAFYEQKWKDIVESDRASRCEPCEGISAFLRIARDAHVPVQPYYLGDGGSPLSGHYSGGNAYRGQVLSCLARAGFDLEPVDPRSLPGYEHQEIYFPGDFHLNPLGIRLLAKAIAKEIRADLESSRGNR